MIENYNHFQFLIDSNNYKWATNCVDLYFEYIYQLYEKDRLDPRSYVDALILLSDALPHLASSKWEEMGYNLCRQIKSTIEKDGINPHMLGMFSGLGKQAFAVNLYFKRSGNLPSLSKTLNELLLLAATVRTQNLMDQSMNTYASYYDCIAGISGILNYLLETSIWHEKLSQISVLIEYLISLTNTYSYKNYQVLKYHIPKDNLYTNLEKELYPDGHLNLSLSHGMMGPLIALSKAKREGIDVIGLDGAINILYDMYMRRKDINEFKKVVWPCYITPYEYAYNIKPMRASLLRKQRSGWCYGNISISRGMELVSHNLNLKSNEALFLKDLVEIINAEPRTYRLDNPGLCHGYASVLSIGMYLFEEIHEEILLDSMVNCIEEIRKIIPDNLTENTINEYFNSDISLLQGAGGLVASIIEALYGDMEYGKLLMIC